MDEPRLSVVRAPSYCHAAEAVPKTNFVEVAEVKVVETSRVAMILMRERRVLDGRRGGDIMGRWGRQVQLGRWAVGAIGQVRWGYVCGWSCGL